MSAAAWRASAGAILTTVLLSSGLVLALALAYRGLHVSNITTIALTFLLVVLVAAAISRLAAAVVTSLVAVLCLNYFFLPPVSSFAVADPENWFVLFAFLAVSVVASNLSSVARTRADEALRRRDEMARLFDLSRDVLLVTDTREALSRLAKFIASRFDLDYVAICLKDESAWHVAAQGMIAVGLDEAELSLAMTDAEQTTMPGAHSPGAGHRVVSAGGHSVRLVPLRARNRPVGLLAAVGRHDPETLDAIGGVTAIAIERVQFLEERKAADLSRQSEEFKSALLASLGHDLRTPLTAIRVAATNLQAGWLTDAEREDHIDLVRTEVDRLTRLFQNILDMARIDAGAVGADLRWVHPSEIVEAAREQVIRTLAHHAIDQRVAGERVVFVDPRLTASALAHVLENAAQYSPHGSTICVTVETTGEGLLIEVRDHGPGVVPGDLPHLFDRFYRGRPAVRRAAGTGMGLSIAKGMLAAEGGRIWAENCADGGAEFSILVPAETRAVTAVEQIG
jgi:two-component system sensor histidine kinase KdpD